MNGYKVCSSCGAWYTKSCACSKRGFASKFVHKTPNSSQRLPRDCAKCGNPVDGHYCRHCALLRKKSKEVWLKICTEQNFFQDFLNTFESSNGDSNVSPQEPIVLNQDPDEKSSQSPPQIDNQCCYGCGDPLDGIFCQRFTCESCGNDAHIAIIVRQKFLLPLIQSHAIIKTLELAEYINIPIWNRPAFSSHDDDDEDYTIAITPEEPDNSLSIGDEHLDTILATESNKVIKSSVENLVPIPSESEGIPNKACDVPFCDNSSPLDVLKDQFEEFFDSNDDSTSIDDDYFSIDNIDYVEASPLDSELIKYLNDNPTPDHVLKPPSPSPIPVEDSDSFLEKSDTSLSYSDNSLPEYETFINHTEETNSSSTTTHADYSVTKYDSFLFEIEPDQGKLTSIVMKYNLAEPRVHVPNVLTTHPTLMLESDFIPSNNSLPEYDIFYFDIEEKNSGSTTIHADISLPDLECFNFNSEPDPGELTSIVDFGIRENVLSATNVNLPPEEDQSPLFAYVVWIFLSFLTYHVVPPNLLSFGNEDTIFDTGISNYHFPSLLPDVSHWCETFMKLSVCSKLLNESPMEILFSKLSPGMN
uniref:Pre-mRNA splicing Prp18-interacting factor n=1 Tax=Tanacetum cinerariifolium TaxID=118510 RepID=A0A6L2K7B4_TANCI|nr:hypothetical protein [Tanacetum cinerariifolium]